MRTGACLDERLQSLSAEIESLSENDTACQRLVTVPGIGPIISSGVVADIGTGSGFKQGRDFAAWLGLVPKQESTGDRTKLGRISKRGNKYLRTLFVQAAHVVIERRPAAAMRVLWPWIEKASNASRTAICWRSRSPTSSPASPGPCLRAVATANRSRPIPPNMSSLRFTKGMDARPLATLARQSWIGQASDGGSEGMASPHSDEKEK